MINEPKQDAQTQKSVRVSIIVNLVLSIAQVVTGWATSSFALIADGMHTFSDLAADFVVLFAAHHSRLGADEDHQYGHARFENAASLALGVMLLAVGTYTAYAAIMRFSIMLHDIPQVGSIALWVAVVVLFVKEGLFHYLLAVAKKMDSSMLIANAWHARSDALSSLIVIVGIMGNLGGYPILDPIAGLIVGIMISKMGFKFSKKAFDDLTDHAISRDEIELIRQTILETEGVIGLHDLRTRRMGDQSVVDVHITVNPDINVREGHDIGARAQQQVMSKYRVLSIIIHVDPADEEDACHEVVGLFPGSK